MEKRVADRRRKSGISIVLMFFLLLLLSVIFLLPLYALLLTSLKPTVKMFTDGITLGINTHVMTLANYTCLFTDKSLFFFYWYRNSIVISVIFTLVGLFFCSAVGYSLAMYKFKGRSLVFTLVIFVMMIPHEILVLPLYQLEVSFKLLNTYLGVILPFVVSPIAIFFFKQYASGLPKELVDAARIDGCTEYGIYNKIMLPLMRPALGAMTILLALNSWNLFLWPLIVMRTNQMLTLPVGLSSLLSPYGNNYAALMSGSVLSILPVMIVFLLNQKSFISGLTVGSVKG